MKDLLASYSLPEIVVFVVMLAFACKELVSIVDWFRERIKKVYDKDHQVQEEHEKLESEIEDLNKFYGERKKIDNAFAETNKTFEALNNQINMLVESDKEDIKAYITEKHHFFVYEKGWIDDYSMECIEKRFAIYEREHGNSFVAGLMNEIRVLPKCPPADVEHKYIGTAEYIRKANE